MSLALIIYMVGTLPSFAKGLILFGSLGTIIATFFKVATVATGADRDDKENEYYAIANLAHKALYWFITLWIVGALIPDKTTSYQMLAAYGVQSVVENKQAQELASDGVDVLKQVLAKAKKELEEKPKEKD